MKKLLLIFGGIAGFSTMSAQSFSPQVTASAGTSMSSGSVAMEFTIGEVVTSTLSAGGDVLTQGFHQPKIVIVAIDPFLDVFSFSVYPNPSDQFVTIETSSKDPLQAKVYNALGQSIFDSQIFSEKTTLDIQHIANGPYLLQITRPTGEPVKNYTLVKRSTN